MKESFLTINKVPTKVITWGKTIEETFERHECKDVVILIPGTVGITTFYTTFLETIHKRTGFPVWVIGHAGHEQPHYEIPDKIPPLKGNERLYGLQGQIDHKVSCFLIY